MSNCDNCCQENCNNCKKDPLIILINGILDIGKKIGRQESKEATTIKQRLEAVENE